LDDENHWTKNEINSFSLFLSRSRFFSRFVTASRQLFWPEHNDAQSHRIRSNCIINVVLLTTSTSIRIHAWTLRNIIRRSKQINISNWRWKRNSLQFSIDFIENYLSTRATSSIATCTIRLRTYADTNLWIWLWILRRYAIICWYVNNIDDRW